MNDRNDPPPDVGKGMQTAANHGLAIVGGVVMMLLAVLMSFTIVMLPISIPLGLAGLVVFFWGLFWWNDGRRTTPPRPQ